MEKKSKYIVGIVLLIIFFGIFIYYIKGYSKNVEDVVTISNDDIDTSSV
jgi:ATP/ADP translocase